MQGRTTFIVAHRVSTLRRADRILVLQGGKIVQSGTHEELMEVKGPYRRAMLLQLDTLTDKPSDGLPSCDDPQRPSP
jgi:ABC-type multidrug transport system fused ATPase/permease subunit